MATSRWDVVLNCTAVVSTVCAVLVTVSVLRRSSGSERGPARTVAAAPREVEEWETLSATGTISGPGTAVLTIVEFSDFECPFCSRFSMTVLSPFIDANPGKVRVVFRHLPLSYHTHARPAARLAECAGEQGMFWEVHDLLFRRQAQLESVDVEATVAAAPSLDESTLRACLESDRPDRRITEDSLAAVGVGARGTPTVVINGWLFEAPPTPAELDSLLTIGTR